MDTCLLKLLVFAIKNHIEDFSKFTEFLHSERGGAGIDQYSESTCIERGLTIGVIIYSALVFVFIHCTHPENATFTQSVRCSAHTNKLQT